MKQSELSSIRREQVKNSIPPLTSETSVIQKDTFKNRAKCHIEQKKEGRKKDDSNDPQLNPTINTTQKKQNHQLQ